MLQYESELEISRILVEWYETYKRELPWRETRDPYIIWISEIILQQTRVVQGLEKKSQYKHRLAQKGTWMYKPAICMDTIISLHKDII